MSDRNLMFISLIFLFFIFSCKNSEKSNENNDETVLDTSEFDFEISDNSAKDDEQAKTNFHTDEKCIIFFMPTESEIVEINKHYGDQSYFDFIQLFSNFKALAVSTRKIVKEKGIFSDLTTSNIIEIETKNGLFIYNRKSTDNIVGQIFYNGQDEPEIKFGLMKNKELTKFIKTYFNVSDYENTEIDSIEQNSNNDEDADAGV